MIGIPRPGEAVAVVGDPGMGASTLLDEVAETARRNGCTVVRTGRAAAPAGSGPTLVVVDDLDPADGPALARLIADRHQLRAGFLLAVHAHQRAALPPGVTTVELQPWPEVRAAALLEAQPYAPRGRARRDILRAAAGNPRAVVELAAAAAASPIADLRRWPLAAILPIRRRYQHMLDALPAGALRVVRHAAARLGDEDTALVLAAAQAGPDDVTAAVFDISGGVLRFRDPLLAAAAYWACPAADRERIHAALRAHLPETAPEWALHLAASATGPDEKVAAALTRREVRGFVDHAAGLERAAELSPDPADAARRRLLALKGLSPAGESGWIIDLVRQIPAGVLPAVDAAHAGCDRVVALSRSGRQREAADRLSEVVRRLPPTTRSQALVLATCAGVVARASGLPEHDRQLADLLELADRLPDGPAASFHVLSEIDDRTMWSAAAAAGAGAAETGFASVCSALIGKALRAQGADAEGDTAGAIALRLSAVEKAREIGAVGVAPELWLPLVVGLLDAGAWQQVDEVLDEADATAAGADLPLLQAEAGLLRGLVAALRGDLATASAHVAGRALTVDPHENGRLHAMVLRARGVIAFQQGDHAGAYRNFRRILDGGHTVPGARPAAFLLLAMAAQRAGRTSETAALLASCRQPTTARARIIGHHAGALLATDADPETAYHVATGPEAAAWPLEQALAHHHYGVWLRRRRRPADARHQLRAALGIFEALGAAGFAAGTRAELAAAGGHPAGVTAGWGERLSALSPRQRQIAELVARGLPDDEIAQRLTISPRTVGNRLYQAYSRLGVSNRHELRELIERG